MAALDSLVHDMAYSAAAGSETILQCAKHYHTAMGKGVMLRMFKNATTARRSAMLAFTYAPAKDWSAYSDVLGYLNKYKPEKEAIMMIGVLIKDKAFGAGAETQSYYILGAVNAETHMNVRRDGRAVIQIDPDLMKPETCDGCDLQANKTALSACAKCLDALYCSEKCQRADWEKRHKGECDSTRAMRAEAVQLLCDQSQQLPATAAADQSGARDHA
jgi:hypothetical protein